MNAFFAHVVRSTPRLLVFAALIAMLVLLAPVAQAAPAVVPVLGGLGGSVTFTSGGAAVVIAPGATITDPDPVGITAARVFIAANMQGGDVLAAAGCAGGITPSYDAAKGILSLNGATTAANYQACLRLVTFSNPANPNNTTARTVTFSLGDAMPYSGTGHWYKYVAGPVNWDAAQTAASGSTYFGRVGYLATITSAGENAFANTKLGAGNTWLGGSDSALEGTWKWVTGPENGTTFCVGGGGNCVPSGGAYTNWNGGEPNSSGNCLLFYGSATGVWDDTVCTATNGYIVEYGGMGGDSTAVISGNVTVNVQNPTTTTITADTPDPSVFGQNYAVNYTVVGGTGTPTGNVTVSDGTNNCTASVATGTCNLPSTSVGAKTLTATYAGDANFNGSTSAGVGHTVNTPPWLLGGIRGMAAGNPATFGNVTASGTGAGCRIWVAWYVGNPVGVGGYNFDPNWFYDVHQENCTSVHIAFNGAPGGGVAFWWNGSQWLVPSNEGAGLFVDVTNSTSPNLGQLGGTLFGVTNGPPEVPEADTLLLLGGGLGGMVTWLGWQYRRAKRAVNRS